MAINKSDNQGTPSENISRREALNKLGYAAFASSTMFLLLNNPTKVYAQSPGTNPPDPGDDPFPMGTTTTDKNGSADDWTNTNDPWQ